MVRGRGEHFVDLLLLKLEETLVGQMFNRLLPADGFGPDQQAGLIAQVEEALVLRVVAAADEVAVHRFEDLHVGQLHGRGHGMAEVRMGLVAVEATELDRLIVEEDIAALHTHLPHADAQMPVVVAQMHSELMQMRAVGRPGAGAGDVEIAFDDPGYTGQPGIFLQHSAAIDDDSQRRAGRGFVGGPAQGEMHAAGFPVGRGDAHVVEPEAAEAVQFDAAGQTAVMPPVEIVQVQGTGRVGQSGAEAVVDQGDEGVCARLVIADVEVESREPAVVFAQRAHLAGRIDQEEPRDVVGAVYDQAMRRGIGEREMGAIGGQAAAAGVTRRGVEAAGHGHGVIEADGGGVDGVGCDIAEKGEIPHAGQIKDAAGCVAGTGQGKSPGCGLGQRPAGGRPT